MAAIPHIQIYQQYAKVGFDADLGKQTIRQPEASLNIHTSKAKLNMESPKGKLEIDQSKAWDALAQGSNLAMMSRIYAQSKSVALQGIARIAEEGDRLADIHVNTNAIADISREALFRTFEMRYHGPALYDNVDIRYIARKPDIRVNEGSVNIQFQMNKPEINYIRGKLDYSMIQYGKVEVIPPQIDLRL